MPVPPIGILLPFSFEEQSKSESDQQEGVICVNWQNCAQKGLVFWAIWPTFFSVPLEVKREKEQRDIGYPMSEKGEDSSQPKEEEAKNPSIDHEVSLIKKAEEEWAEVERRQGGTYSLITFLLFFIITNFFVNIYIFWYSNK